MYKSRGAMQPGIFLAFDTKRADPDGSALLS